MKEVQIKPDKKINCPMIVVWSFVPDHSLLLSPFFFVLNSGKAPLQFANRCGPSQIDVSALYLANTLGRDISAKDKQSSQPTN
jgi:hypothetical protein